MNMSADQDVIDIADLANVRALCLFVIGRSHEDLCTVAQSHALYDMAIWVLFGARMQACSHWARCELTYLMDTLRGLHRDYLTRLAAAEAGLDRKPHPRSGGRLYLQ